MVDLSKVVQVDSRGQLVIPMALRKKLGIGEGTAFWIYDDNGSIVLDKISKPKKRK